MKLKLHIGILFFCLTISLHILGQENYKVNQINEIKKSGDYVYAEATMLEQEQAEDAAMTLLHFNIENWMKSSEMSLKVNDVSLLAYTKIINARRGDQHRVFVYINKSDLTQENVHVSKNKEVKNVKDIFNVVDLTECTVVVEGSENIGDDSQSYLLNEVEKDMLRIRRFEEIKSFIENLKTKECLNRYGKYATLPKNGKFHMFIYSQTGDVVACLLKTDNEYYNLNKLMPDSIGNYKRCGSIWFEIIK